MDNFVKVTDATQLNKLFEMAQDKLIVLMFFTKHNPDCRRLVSSFEKISCNNAISLFVLVDMDKFDGESRYVAKNTNGMPRIECFFMGNSIGSLTASSERDIENSVRAGQQHVMMNLNMKNQITQNPMNSMNPMNQVGQMGSMSLMGQNIPQINPMQVQQQILNTVQQQNPQQFQYLLQNPAALQQMVQNQIQVMRQQQILQQQQQQQQQQMMMSQANLPMMMPTSNLPVMMPQQGMIGPQQTLSLTSGMSQQPVISGVNNVDTTIIPTFQQMQQMFQIFQMMQQMGIINPQQVSIPPMQSPTTPTDNIPINDFKSVNSMGTSTNTEDTITLPNGDKIVTLPNGKFGLIKKN